MRQKYLNKFVSLRVPFVIGCLLLSVTFFPLIQGKSLLFGDNYSLMVPGKLFSSLWLAKGVIPLWNPTQFAGISWVGDINQSLFYPSTLFFILFRPSVALNITVLIHLLLCFIGAYLLAREVSPKLQIYGWLVTAVVWTFSPQVITAVNNLATLQSLSYVPWVVLGCLHIGRKRDGSWLYLPILICLQLLGGYPQHVLFSVIFGFLFSWVFHRLVLSKWIFVGLLSLLLSTWIWLPFLQNVNQSTRSLQTTEQAQTGSLTVNDLIKIISPVFFENPLKGYKWGPGWNRPSIPFLYFTWIGIAALTVSIFRNKKEKIDVFLLGTLLICILIAFGEATPLYTLLQQIPVVESSRGASTILVIASLAGALLVSRAIFNLNITSIVYKKYFLACFIISSILLISWLTSRVYFDNVWQIVNSATSGVLQNSAFHTIEKDRILFSSILLSVSIQSILLLLSTWFLSKRKLFAFILILAFDMVFFTRQHYFFGPSSVYDLPSNSELIAEVTYSLGNNFRLLTRNYNVSYTDFGAYYEALILRQPFSDSFVDASELTSFSIAQQMKDLVTPGWNTPVNIRAMNGYTTLLPASISKDFSNTSSEHGINRLPEISTTHEQLKKWSIGYYLVDTWYPDYGEQFPDTIVASGDGWNLYQLPDTLTRIRNKNGENAHVIDFDENPNELVMTIESDREQDLVVADRYDQDWKAIVNGKLVEVSDVDGMRSIPLELGTNQIRLWYSPTFFYVGLFISGATGITLLIWMSIRSYRWQTK